MMLLRRSRRGLNGWLQAVWRRRTARREGCGLQEECRPGAQEGIGLRWRRIKATADGRRWGQALGGTSAGGSAGDAVSEAGSVGVGGTAELEGGGIGEDGTEVGEGVAQTRCGGAHPRLLWCKGGLINQAWRRLDYQDKGLGASEALSAATTPRFVACALVSVAAHRTGRSGSMGIFPGGMRALPISRLAPYRAAPVRCWPQSGRATGRCQRSAMSNWAGERLVRWQLHHRSWLSPLKLTAGRPE